MLDGKTTVFSASSRKAKRACAEAIGNPAAPAFFERDFERALRKGRTGNVADGFFHSLLRPMKFSRQRFVDFAMTLLVRIIPKTIVAMTAIVPTGMVQDGIKADTIQRNAAGKRRLDFLRHIAQPRAARLVFGAGFSHEHGPLVAFVNLLQDFSQR